MCNGVKCMCMCDGVKCMCVCVMVRRWGSV